MSLNFMKWNMIALHNFLKYIEVKQSLILWQSKTSHLLRVMIGIQPITGLVYMCWVTLFLPTKALARKN